LATSQSGPNVAPRRESVSAEVVRQSLRTAIMAGHPAACPPVNIADLRREYLRAALAEADVDPDPLRQFDRWLSEAVRAEMPEPTAMTLATADTDGRPSARIVLLKGADAQGFVFYTNYASRKGSDLAARAQAALLFHWVELERQVRVEGPVAKVAEAESDAYFATRPLLSRLGAWASPQSRAIPDRGWLEREFAAAQRRVGADGESVPRPSHWGGYRLVPEVMEFWQGRQSRLHDRIRYARDGGTWRIARLAP
jgi:pyridoxamine 5'-phosphate oxidase